MARIYPHELIGQVVKIIKAPQLSVVGLQGKIVDESYKTLVIEVLGKQKRVFKSSIVFELIREKVQLSGKNLIRRSEERVKGI